MVVKVRNFYLNTQKSKHEYYNIAIELIPKYIIDKYNLPQKQIDGFLYISVEKGIYGLVQDVIIAHITLKEHIYPFGYESATTML